MIVGIDEVGRGPWAGPLVVGAVVMGDAVVEGLTDSKRLTKLRREALSKQLLEQVASYGLGWVSAEEIDAIGLSESLRLATRRALEQIDVPYHDIIIDGTINFLEGTTRGKYVTTMKKADLLIASVSAASVLAKVARDDYMDLQAETYPEYGFESHMGYGTARHKLALEQYGLTLLHRKSFAPVAALVGAREPNIRTITGTNKDTGNKAESFVAKRLERDGYAILEMNWRTKFCEIDIIAQKDDTLFFVEVKHRKTKLQGGGIAAITPRKLRQMRFAASLYLTKHIGRNARLAVASTSEHDDKIQMEDLLLLE